MGSARHLDREQTFGPTARTLSETTELAPWVGDVLAVSADPSLAEHPDFHDGWGEIRERHVPSSFCSPASTRWPEASDIVVTDKDKRRLEQLLRATHWHETNPRQAAALREELARAAIVGAQTVPPDVVTMKSRVVCQDMESGARSELQLVYPWEAHARKATLSVLSDLGMSLLGTSVGQQIELPEDARWRPSLRVASLQYQPEREGHFHL